MRWRPVELFVAVARYGGATKAAAALNISQSSVSRQLTKFQRDLGIKLLKNNGRGFELTEEGRRFLPKAERALSSVAELANPRSQPSSETKAGAFVIAGSNGTSGSVLASLTTRFKNRHPELDVMLQSGSSKDVEELVAKSEVAIGLVTNPTSSPALHTEFFRKEALAPFVRANHPVARKGKLGPEELAKLPLVIKAGKDRPSRAERFLKALTDKGLKPSVFLRCDSSDSIKGAVKKNRAVGILYRDLIETAVQRGIFKILNVSGVDLTGSSYIVYSNEWPLSSAALEFLALLRAAREDGHLPPP